MEGMREQLGGGVKDYGKELILDLHNCDSKRFNRLDIRYFFGSLCEKINMKTEKLYWWDDRYTPKAERETEDHLVGTSAVQFIKTSNITIHALTKMKRAYINIFSCKGFNSKVAANFSCKYFNGYIAHQLTIRRV